MTVSASRPLRHSYRIYGVIVDSEFPLSSVPKCEGSLPATIAIALGAEADFERRAAALRQDCDDWIRYTELADGSLYIRINTVLEAIVEADGRQVICRALEDAADRTFEANLVNFALSASLTLQGEECLHSTVVAFEGKAIGLLGPSGAGKSTLAAQLLRDGAALLTDDMLRVTFEESGVFAHPGPFRLKLFEEAAQRLLPDGVERGPFNRLSGKIMIEPQGLVAAMTALPLTALIWLGEDEPTAGEGNEISFRKLVGIAPVKVLTGSTMVTRYAAPARLSRQLRFAERLARIVPIYALTYSRDYRLLADVSRKLQRMARG